MLKYSKLNTYSKKGGFEKELIGFLMGDISTPIILPLRSEIMYIHPNNNIIEGDKKYCEKMGIKKLDKNVVVTIV